MDAFSQPTLWDVFFLNENVWILIKILLKFVPKSPINNIPASDQMMDRSWSGDKPLSESMMIRLPMHTCVTRPQWVNTWNLKGQEWQHGKQIINSQNNKNLTPVIVRTLQYFAYDLVIKVICGHKSYMLHSQQLSLNKHFHRKWTIYIFVLQQMTYRWVSARNTYFRCVSNGVMSFLH